MRLGVYAFLVFVVGIVSCQKPTIDSIEPILVKEDLIKTPQGFPEVPFPADNPFSWAKWKLGKKLFYDNILSKDTSINCSSCHLASNAFSDIVSTSPGVDDEPGTRNSPTLANIAYLPYFTREGGVPTLEMQVLVPIQEHNEFNTNIVILSERLNAIPEYIEMSLEAFDRRPDPYVITRAISTFERTLISGDSPFDQYEYQGEPTALSTQAIRGMNLFFSERTSCSNCHAGFNFTDNRFTNNGLYEEYPDEGRFRLTREETDRAVFKVPTLRNVGLTSPYMHDGSLSTLRQVLEHYNTGGFDHPNKSELLKPLNLTAQEIEDLETFLNALTDEKFATNPLLSN